MLPVCCGADRQEGRATRGTAARRGATAYRRLSGGRRKRERAAAIGTLATYRRHGGAWRQARFIPHAYHLPFLLQFLLHTGCLQFSGCALPSSFKPMQLLSHKRCSRWFPSGAYSHPIWSEGGLFYGSPCCGGGISFVRTPGGGSLRCLRVRTPGARLAFCWRHFAAALLPRCAHHSSRGGAFAWRSLPSAARNGRRAAILFSSEPRRSPPHAPGCRAHMLLLARRSGLNHRVSPLLYCGYISPLNISCGPLAKAAVGAHAREKAATRPRSGMAAGGAAAAATAAAGGRGGGISSARTINMHGC